MISDAERAALLEDLRAQAKLRHHEKDRRIAAYLLGLVQAQRKLERDARIGQQAITLYRLTAEGVPFDRLLPHVSAQVARIESAIVEDDADA